MHPPKTQKSMDRRLAMQIYNRRSRARLRGEQIPLARPGKKVNGEKPVARPPQQSGRKPGAKTLARQAAQAGAAA